MHFSKKDKNTENNLKVYGPATNCKEFALLGYSLNGYHLIKKKDKSTNILEYKAKLKNDIVLIRY